MPPRSSASTMYTVKHIDSFEVLVGNRVAGFIERLKDSNNSIIFCIDNSWKMKFDIWDPWIKLLFKYKMLFCSSFNFYILLYISLLYLHVYLSMGYINLKYSVLIFISIFNHLELWTKALYTFFQ